MTDTPDYNLPPMHPGEMLREEFLVPLRISAGQLAKAAGVARPRIDRILRGEAAVTAEMALRLGKVLDTGADFWLTLQARHDMLQAQAAFGPALAVLQPLVRKQ